MTKHTHRWAAGLNGGQILMGILLIGLLTGCKTARTPVAWKVTINARTTDSIRLDLVGINRLEKPDWDRLDIDKYWATKSNSLRDNVDRVTLELVDQKIHTKEIKGVSAESKLEGEGTQTIILPKSHPIWRKWLGRNAVGLVVIGEFPIKQTDVMDTRKKILPLYKQYWRSEGMFWNKKRILEIDVQRGHIQINTPTSDKAEEIAF